MRPLPRVCRASICKCTKPSWGAVRNRVGLLYQSFGWGRNGKCLCIHYICYIYMFSQSLTEISVQVEFQQKEARAVEACIHSRILFAPILGVMVFFFQFTSTFLPGVKLTSAEICLSTLWCPEPKNNSSTLGTATNVRTFVHRFEAKVWWHYMLKRRSWTPIVAEMIKCILSAAQMIIVCPWFDVFEYVYVWFNIGTKCT